MTTLDSIAEESTKDDSNDVEIKLEYPEIDIEEINPNSYSTSANIKKIQHQPMFHDPGYNLWTSKATSCLISQYKKYRSMVGQTTRFRSLRDMFDTISVEMQKHGFFFSPQKCENKWRVLERKYKNLVLREMMKKPGRMKHYGHWEHKRALDEIFNEKRKSVYLTESEYPAVSGSTKYAFILPSTVSQQNSTQIVNGTIEKLKKTINKSSKNSFNVQTNDDLSNSNASSNVNEDSSKESSAVNFEKILMEMKKYFEIAEKNKQRRHLEKMAMRQSELEVQEKLLKIKEQKLELEKSKIIALAQSIQ